MEAWVAELQRGNLDAAWDQFVGRYRRLIFAAIRHYAQDYDDVMDVFAQVCQALREDGLRRIRAYTHATEHRAKFSTWLLTVVQNLTVDWFRHRDGRRRLSALAQALPPLRRSIYEYVFLKRRSHIEAYELIHASEAPTMSFRDFLSEVRATYQAVTEGRRGQVWRDIVYVPLDDHALPAEPVSADAVEAAELSQLAERALDALPADDRAIVELFVLEALPAETVAKILGLPNPKAVYNRAYRALAIVREQLERSGIQRGDL